MENINRVLAQITNSTNNSQIPATPSTTGIRGAFTEDEKQKVAVFFSRLTTIYGRGKVKSLWGDSEDQLKVMRKEWAKTIGKFSFEGLDIIFDRLRQKLADGNPDYTWPDIPKVLRLARTNCRHASHQVLPRGLPEPESVKQRRMARGRLATQTVKAVLAGSACFLEDKPEVTYEN